MDNIRKLLEFLDQNSLKRIVVSSLHSYPKTAQHAICLQIDLKRLYALIAPDEMSIKVPDIETTSVELS